MVGLDAQRFQPASNWVETIEKALLATAVVFAGSNSCYVCVIFCAICTACVTLIVNKKDGICVAHPLIHFLQNLLKRLREKKRQQHECCEHPSCLPCVSMAERLRGSLVMIIPRSDRVLTENGWKEFHWKMSTALTAVLSISFEVDVPFGKLGGSLLFECQRREPPRGLWGMPPPPPRKF